MWHTASTLTPKDKAIDQYCSRGRSCLGSYTYLLVEKPSLAVADSPQSRAAAQQHADTARHCSQCRCRQTGLCYVTHVPHAPSPACPVHTVKRKWAGLACRVTYQRQELIHAAHGHRVMAPTSHTAVQNLHFTQYNTRLSNARHKQCCGSGSKHPNSLSAHLMEQSACMCCLSWHKLSWSGQRCQML